MTTIDIILASCFWASAAGVVYAYVGYPVVIYFFSRVCGKPPVAPIVAEADLPRLALLIVAHNEASMIEARIENALAMSYPPDRFEIVVASDGSDDTMCDICRRYAGRVRTLDFTDRRGKAGALNEAVSHLDADVIVFSDANTFMEPDAARRLAGWFEDESVGAVCGRLILRDPISGRNVDSVYWRYETFLKQCEGRLGGLLGANGAIYAMRRALFTPLPPGTIVDDFVIPLTAKLRRGCRIVYDIDAIAHEDAPADLSAEFSRRSRIGIGGFQSLSMLWPLLHARHGWTAFTFASHKALRWVCPFLLVVALLAPLALANHPIYAALFLIQLVLYALCAVGAILPPGGKFVRVLRVFAMFAGMNVALLTGFFQWLRSSQTGIWKRTERADVGLST
jgi:cellulose synthase/poly-beta-1,6-N-acetylglucosamine synthase-like glycosyltransferase